MASVYVVGTFDTKGQELAYVRDLVAAAVQSVTTVDLSTGPDGDSGDDADVPARQVAGYHPNGADGVFSDDRGTAVSAMAVAFEHFAVQRRGDLAGMIGLGGSGGTALGRAESCHGFYGASSMERLPAEGALTDQTKAFKKITF